MSALTAARQNVSNKGTVIGTLIGYKAAASQTFFHNGKVAVNAAGYLVPASSTAGLRVVGIADLQGQGSVVSSAVAGATVILVATGIFPFFSGTGSDAVTQADEMNDVYCMDDQTISRLPGAGRPISGQLIKIDGGLFFVRVGPEISRVGAAASAGTAFQGKGSIETGVASGAVSVATELTTLNLANGAAALTLANGLFIGQRKTIVVAGITGTPNATLTPATPSGFATVSALGALGDSVELIWANPTSPAWYIASSNGVNIA